MGRLYLHWELVCKAESTHKKRERKKSGLCHHDHEWLWQGVHTQIHCGGWETRKKAKRFDKKKFAPSFMDLCSMH